jgi:hypothetical protein
LLLPGVNGSVEPVPLLRKPLFQAVSQAAALIPE